MVEQLYPRKIGPEITKSLLHESAVHNVKPRFVSCTNDLNIILTHPQRNQSSYSSRVNVYCLSLTFVPVGASTVRSTFHLLRMSWLLRMCLGPDFCPIKNSTRAATNAKVKNVYGFKASKLMIRDKVSASFVRLKKKTLEFERQMLINYGRWRPSYSMSIPCFGT
jgi:hypothetical protein